MEIQLCILEMIPTLKDLKNVSDASPALKHAVLKYLSRMTECCIHPGLTVLHPSVSAKNIESIFYFHVPHLRRREILDFSFVWEMYWPVIPCVSISVPVYQHQLTLEVAHNILFILHHQHRIEHLRITTGSDDVMDFTLVNPVIRFSLSALIADIRIPLVEIFKLDNFALSAPFVRQEGIFLVLDEDKAVICPYHK